MMVINDIIRTGNWHPKYLDLPEAIIRDCMDWNTIMMTYFQEPMAITYMQRMPEGVHLTQNFPTTFLPRMDTAL